MVCDCSLDFGSYCMRLDVMGCEEQVGRDGLSFDSDDGGERVAAGDGEGCDSSNDPFAVTHAVVELKMGATGAEEKGVSQPSRPMFLLRQVGYRRGKGIILLSGTLAAIDATYSYKVTPQPQLTLLLPSSSSAIVAAF
ncbi:hypothetical protein BHE74_00030529 [Ensete ventricosum]|nr:hypothetical protein BHE74_00030529 [Ensete ventricosum]